jgi:hypothetical protein
MTLSSLTYAYVGVLIAAGFIAGLAVPSLLVLPTALGRWPADIDVPTTAKPSLAISVLNDFDQSMWLDVFNTSFTPFMTVAARSFKFAGPITLECCQKLAMAQVEVDGYQYDNMSRCWLVQAPLHPHSPHDKFPNYQPLPTECIGCRYFQLKPDRVAAALMQLPPPDSNKAQGDAPQYNMLNDPEAVKAATAFCRTKENTVALLIVDSGNEAFLRLWLYFWYRVRATFRNVVIIAQDPELYRTMSNLLPGQVLLEASAKLMNSEAASYDTPAIHHRMRRRFYQLGMVAASGVNVLYADVDTLLFCDLIATLKKSTQMRSAIDDPIPGMMCAGLIYAPASVTSLQVMMLADTCLFHNILSVNDQICYNQAIRVIPNHFQMLPRDSFPTALDFWAKLTANITEPEALAQDAMKGVCSLHNNWIVGAANKAERFRVYGFDQNPVTDDHIGFQELQNQHSDA